MVVPAAWLALHLHAAATSLQGDTQESVILEQLSLQAPLWLDADETRALQVAATPSGAGWHLRVSSRGPQQAAWLCHAEASVCTGGSLSPLPTCTKELSSATQVAVNTLYNALEKLGYGLTETFCALASAAVIGKRVQATVTCGPGGFTAGSQDSALHAIAAVAMPLGGATHVQLPLAIERYWCDPSQATQHLDVTAQLDENGLADVDVVATSGAAVAKVRGLSMRPLPAPAASPATANAGMWLGVRQFLPMPAVAATSGRPLILVALPDCPLTRRLAAAASNVRIVDNPETLAEACSPNCAVVFVGHGSADLAATPPEDLRRLQATYVATSALTAPPRVWTLTQQAQWLNKSDAAPWPQQAALAAMTRGLRGECGQVRPSCIDLPANADAADLAQAIAAIAADVPPTDVAVRAATLYEAQLTRRPAKDQSLCLSGPGTDQDQSLCLSGPNCLSRGIAVPVGPRCLSRLRLWPRCSHPGSVFGNAWGATARDCQSAQPRCCGAGAM